MQKEQEQQEPQKQMEKGDLNDRYVLSSLPPVCVLVEYERLAKDITNSYNRTALALSSRRSTWW